MFVFEQLQPNHAYSIVLPVASIDRRAQCTSTDRSSAAGKGASGLVLGSFTTLASPAEQLLQLQQLLLRGGGGVGVEMSTDSALFGAKSDLQAVQELRQMVSPAAVQAQQQAEQQSRSDGKVRLLVVGADKPSWRWVVPSSFDQPRLSAGERQQMLRPASDREQLQRGALLKAEVRFSVLIGRSAAA